MRESEGEAAGGALVSFFPSLVAMSGLVDFCVFSLFEFCPFFCALFSREDGEKEPHSNGRVSHGLRKTVGWEFISKLAAASAMIHSGRIQLGDP